MGHSNMKRLERWGEEEVSQNEKEVTCKMESQRVWHIGNQVKERTKKQEATYFATC